MESKQSGRFLVGWTPPPHLQNRVDIRNGVKYPGNEHLGCFGCDSYDISGVVVGKGSNGALHGTKFNMDDAPSNEFSLSILHDTDRRDILRGSSYGLCVLWHAYPCGE